MVDLPEMTFPVTITNEETGETSEETKNAELLLVKWQDDSNLVVLGSLQNYSTTQAPYIWPVSYTHLDVYKRQCLCPPFCALAPGGRRLVFSIIPQETGSEQPKNPSGFS